MYNNNNPYITLGLKDSMYCHKYQNNMIVSPFLLHWPCLHIFCCLQAVSQRFLTLCCIKNILAHLVATSNKNWCYNVIAEEYGIANKWAPRDLGASKTNLVILGHSEIRTTIKLFHTYVHIIHSKSPKNFNSERKIIWRNNSISALKKLKKSFTVVHLMLGL